MNIEFLSKKEYFSLIILNGIISNSYGNGNCTPLSEGSIKDLCELAVYFSETLLNEIDIHEKRGDR